MKTEEPERGVANTLSKNQQKKVKRLERQKEKDKYKR